MLKHDEGLDCDLKSRESLATPSFLLLIKPVADGLDVPTGDRLIKMFSTVERETSNRRLCPHRETTGLHTVGSYNMRPNSITVHIILTIQVFVINVLISCTDRGLDMCITQIRL